MYYEDAYEMRDEIKRYESMHPRSKKEKFHDFIKTFFIALAVLFFIVVLFVSSAKKDKKHDDQIREESYDEGYEAGFDAGFMSGLDVGYENCLYDYKDAISSFYPDT